MTTFHWSRAPCFIYETFYVLDYSDDTDKTSYFSGFDPTTSTLTLTGNSVVIGTTQMYELYVVSMKQDGTRLNEVSLDIFTVEWKVYCDPATVPTLNYGTYASNT